MARRAGISIRSFRDGDEVALSRIFNEYVARFAGPRLVTPESWRRQFIRRSWNGPSVDEDPDSVRVAERAGHIVGYAVTDYSPFEEEHAAVVQELCAASGEPPDEIFPALLEDAERRARERGKDALSLLVSSDDGPACRAASALGFVAPPEDAGVFMAAVVDLAQLLHEMSGELSRRLRESDLATWEGVVRVKCGRQSATLRVRGGQVSRAPARARADVSADIDREALIPLLFGQQPVREAYLQDRLTVTAGDREEVLRLLDALFPPMPLFLPRAQWW